MNENIKKIKESHRLLMKFPDTERPVVVVMGLGFVGSAMAIAVSAATNTSGERLYNVIGVDVETEQGLARVDALNKGQFPFETNDSRLEEAVGAAFKASNLIATIDTAAYMIADIIVVDVHLDASIKNQKAHVDFGPFQQAIRTLGKYMPAEALVLIETTVPPGTCSEVVEPILRKEFMLRGLNSESINIAHSYERVMPGSDYLASIINYWRVYSGLSEEAANRCGAFLSTIIDVEKFPLKRLKDTTTSELAKILENSYRAVNIAFIDEWAVLAENLKIDLFDTIDAIRCRPTHKNIMRPGLGVGGYCLTKDPVMALYSNSKLEKSQQSDFVMTQVAMNVNASMPKRNANRFAAVFDDGVCDKRVLMLGAAYRSEVDDTRFSASEVFYRTLKAQGAIITVHDPYVKYWSELELALPKKLPSPKSYDAVVFCVGHNYYADMDVGAWLGDARPQIYDCDFVLSKSTLEALAYLGLEVRSTGRG